MPAPIAVVFMPCSGSGLEVGAKGIRVCTVDGMSGGAVVSVPLVERVDEELSDVTFEVNEVVEISKDESPSVEDCCTLDDVLVGRIQNRRLQNPSLYSASASP